MRGATKQQQLLAALPDNSKTEFEGSEAVAMLKKLYPPQKQKSMEEIHLHFFGHTDWIIKPVK